MIVAEFFNCCGITILAEFGHHGGTPLEVGERQKILEFLNYRIKNGTRVGLLTIALNENQIKVGIEEIVLEVGFKPLIEKFYHPGHGRRITLYGYEMHPHKRKELEPKVESTRDDTKKVGGLFSKPTSRARTARSRVRKLVPLQW